MGLAQSHPSELSEKDKNISELEKILDDTIMEKDKEVVSLQLSVQDEQKRCAGRHSTIINLKQDLRNARIEKEKKLQFLEDEMSVVTSRQEDKISVLEDRLSNVTSQKDANVSELEQLAEDNSRLARENC
ncbi:hypothetical protein LTS18_012386 [Coniosporium uncinatum]|uniref:Uncharacterized protein n=1 Tax=Coniosporium uncinatum TaxID=93489 RepID=A0ACC3DW09_9PEZI|nr:hypothetical protein LTS18_012386 [Coniosporium uncinatum]